jgi:hypothetical protein
VLTKSASMKANKGTAKASTKIGVEKKGSFSISLQTQKIPKGHFRERWLRLGRDWLYTDVLSGLTQRLRASGPLDRKQVPT